MARGLQEKFEWGRLLWNYYFKAPVHIITGSAGCEETHDPWLPKPEMTAFRSADYGYSRMVAHNTTHLEVAQVSDDQVSNFGNFYLKKEK